MAHGLGHTKARKHENAQRTKNKKQPKRRQEDFSDDEQDHSVGKECQELSAEVLALLKKTTGLDDAEAWRNIWLLVSKSEHDNADPAKAFLTDKGKSLFSYASALSYDWKDRGVTMGIVGWTTACDGHDGKGDAPVLFKIYKDLGGDDLMKYCNGCTKDKSKCSALIKKIESLAKDPKWVQAQWKQLVTKADDGAYLFHTIDTWKKLGIANPSALAIATVFDASLNQGYSTFLS